MFQLFGKKKITEESAIDTFFPVVLDDLKADWSAIQTNLENYISFSTQEKEAVILEFFIVVVTLQSIAVYNLFSKNQATRLSKQIKQKMVSLPSLGEYAQQMMKVYTDAYNLAVKERTNPLETVSMFLAKALRDNSGKTLEKSILGNQQINPLLLATLQSILVSHSSYWSRLKSKYQLIK